MSQIPPPNPPQRPQPPSKPQYDNGAGVAKKAAVGGGVLLIIFAVVGVVIVMGLCVIGILAALLIPAVGTAREAAQRAQSMNHVRQLSLAMLNYEAQNANFPPQYTVDAAGQPLQSWRTLLLPMIEQQSIFDSINQNEAWDSPANATFTDTSIPTFISPRYGQSGNLTNYVAIAGEGFAFNGPQQVRMANLADGSTNTILFVEIANSDIAWAEPRDLTIGELQLEGAGASPDAVNVVLSAAVVGFADGHVTTLQTSDPEELRKLLTIDGKEPVARW